MLFFCKAFVKFVVIADQKFGVVYDQAVLFGSAIHFAGSPIFLNHLRALTPT